MVMVVHRDDREWKIHATLDNENCPYLFYPINIHGCRHPSKDNVDDWQPCKFEDCPLLDTREDVMEASKAINEGMRQLFDELRQDDYSIFLNADHVTVEVACRIHSIMGWPLEEDTDV